MTDNNHDFRTLRVYQLAYQMAMAIYVETKSFPKEELYSLVDQIRRSSRGVCGCIAEGYRKRIYPNSFRSKMVDADGECSETTIWLDFSRDCGYITPVQHAAWLGKYAEVGRMLHGMIDHPEKFLPKT